MSWSLLLQNYEFDVEYVKVKNIADEYSHQKSIASIKKTETKIQIDNQDKKRKILKNTTLIVATDY
ncbi:hypothetical protein GVAV_000108 [Gurleya vavrai]